jgi:hypothetical protein
MTGDDQEIQRVTNYEDKKLVANLKPQKMTLDVQESIKREIQMGFTASLDGAQLPIQHQSLLQALPASAITQEEDKEVISGMEILMKAADVSTEASDVDSGLAPSLASVLSASGATEQSGNLEAATAKSSVLAALGGSVGGDIGSTRNNLKTTCAENLKKAVKKLGLGIDSAWKVIQYGDSLNDHSFFQTIVERCTLSLLFKGMEPATVVGETGEPAIDFKLAPIEVDFTSDTPDTPPGTPIGEEGLASLHTARVKAALGKMELCPIESAEEFISLTEMYVEISKISTLKSLVEIEGAHALNTKWCQMIVQLQKSLATATNDLSRQNKKAENDYKKTEKELTDKVMKETIAKTTEEEAQAKRNIAKEKNTSHFVVDWVALGHRSILEIMEASTLHANDDELNKPFFVKDLLGKHPNAGLADPTLKESLQRWTNDCPKRLKSLNETMTSAPMMLQHGSAALDAIFDTYLQPSSLLVDGLPSLKNIVDKPWFFGMVSTTVHTGIEVDFLGTARIVTSGSLRYLMASAKDLYAHLPEDVQKRATNADGKKIAYEKMKDLIRSGKEDDIKSLLPNVVVSQGLIGPGEMVVTPPGWIVAYTPRGNEPVLGIKKSFLYKSRVALSNLEAINHVVVSKVLEGFLDYMSISVPPAAPPATVAATAKAGVPDAADVSEPNCG